MAFVGRTGAHNAIERMDGLKEAAGDKFKELDRMGTRRDRTKARDNVRNALRNHPDLKLLAGIWSYNAPAIVDVIQETGKRKDVKVVVFDAEKLAIDQMGDGMIDAMIVQNPYDMGYQTARLLKARDRRRGDRQANVSQRHRARWRSVRHGAEDRGAGERLAAEGRDVWPQDRVSRPRCV